MTVFLLVRHGSHDLLSKTLAGRMPGVALNNGGVDEVERLAGRLASLPVRAVYSSPIQRALETAAPVAQQLGLEVEINEAFIELDFGEWTGLSFDELHKIKGWGYFNTFRSGTRIPGGETMLEVQARTVGELGRLREKHGDDLVCVVAHGDVIKAALLYYLGAPIDLMKHIEISPASVSVLALHSYSAQVQRMNDTGDLSVLMP